MRVDFYYFSGTGNTFLIVKAMKEAFEKHGVKTFLHRIEKTKAVPYNESIVGLAFPVALQGTYPFVWKFVKSLPSARNRKIFMVDTLESFSGGIIGPVKKIVTSKGYLPIGALEIKMPSNLLNKNIDRNVNALKVKNGLEIAKEYAENLIARSTRWKRFPVISDLMSTFSKSKKTWSFFRKIFKMESNEEKCIKCGLCERLCPVDNIFIDERVKFGNECVFCMRCISFCPTEAIEMRRFGKRIEFKKYRAVTVNELIKDDDEEQSG